MIRSVTMALCAFMVAFALNQGFTQGTADENDSPKSSIRAKQMPFRGTIVKIDLERKIVTLGGKERDRAFTVTDQSKIKRHGQTAKLDDVLVGDFVGGLARANGEKWEVVTLNVSEKPDKPQGKEATKKNDA